MNPSTVISLHNKNIRLRIAPDRGCHWLSLQLRMSQRWVDILEPVKSLQSLVRHPFEGGLYLMAPWCNRLPRASFRFRKKNFQLKPNFRDGSAMHGDLMRQRWEVLSKSADHFMARFNSVDSDFNFPFPLFFEHKIILASEQVIAQLSVHNRSGEAAPVGIGFHPFFNRYLKVGTRNDLHLRLPHRQVFSKSGPFPSAKKESVHSKFKEAFPWNLAAKEFDHTFEGVRDNQPIELSYPPFNLNLEITTSSNLGKLFIYSPRKHNGRLANFSCVEPMTMIPNGFELMNKGVKNTGVEILKPKQWLRTELRFRFRRDKLIRS